MDSSSIECRAIWYSGTSWLSNNTFPSIVSMLNAQSNAYYIPSRKKSHGDVQRDWQCEERSVVMVMQHVNDTRPTASAHLLLNSLVTVVNGTVVLVYLVCVLQQVTMRAGHLKQLIPAAGDIRSWSTESKQYPVWLTPPIGPTSIDLCQVIMSRKRSLYTAHPWNYFGQRNCEVLTAGWLPDRPVSLIKGDI